jgi:predicted Na+-dependent transporter
MKVMNMKRMFGGLLTVLGIVGIIYAAVIFANSSSSASTIKQLIIYGVIGIIFFVAGIGLIRSTKDES